MEPPTLRQQRALAYAPKPFAAVAFLSSSYVIYHLLFQHPEKRKRIYHRIMFAMNLSVLPQSIVIFWGTWAAPRGTPNMVGAVGNILTCTIGGFLDLTFSFVVPIYYASLSIVSYLSVKNNFQEVKYLWIEKWIHICAYLFPLSLSISMAANELINPYGSGCFASAAPRGCEDNPDVECVRGNANIHRLVWIFGFGQILVYFIIPPIAMAFVCMAVKRVQKDAARCTGMRQIIESARKKMIIDVAVQIGLYLFSFWLTYIFSIAHYLVKKVTGNLMYDLVIVANCLLSSQGFFIMLVYFKLQSQPVHKIAKTTITAICSYSARSSTNTLPQSTAAKKIHIDLSRENSTVADIRAAATSTHVPIRTPPEEKPSRSCSFQIFDGVPDQDSPWAKFFESFSDEEEQSHNAANDPADGDHAGSQRDPSFPPPIKRKKSNDSEISLKSSSMTDASSVFHKSDLDVVADES